MGGYGAEDDSNFQTFRECLSAAILRRGQVYSPKLAKKRRSEMGGPKTKKGNDKNGLHTVRDDPEDLADFIGYLASETFWCLPEEIRTLSYSTVRNDARVRERYEEPLPDETIGLAVAAIPAEVEDSLLTYKYVDPPRTDVTSFISPVLSSYISAVTAAPPEWISTRASACEVCERDWIPLTYHHLIPRSVHARVLKRGWHEEWMLNSVAWLCRACHSFVHRMATNEELAKEWYTVDKILARDDVQSWRAWVGRVRWKAK